MDKPTVPNHPTYAELNRKTGNIEIIDMVSGRVVAVYRDNGIEPIGTELVKFETSEGPVYLGPGVSADSVSELKSRVQYSETLLDLICEDLAKGTPLTRICSRPNRPSYGLLMRWRRDYPGVSDRLREARLMQGEAHFDRALELSESQPDKDDLPGVKLAVETRKWAAQVTDQDSFTTRQRVDANIGVTSYIIDTGIKKSRDVSSGVSSQGGDLVGGTEEAESSDIGVIDSGTGDT